MKKASFVFEARGCSFLAGVIYWVAAILISIAFCSCVLPIPQTKTVMDTRNGNAGSQPPSLGEWHKDYPLKIVLVHGMGNHPFSSNSDPELLGAKSYSELHDWLLHRYPTDAVFQKKVQDAAVKAQYATFISECIDRVGLDGKNEPKPDFRLIYDGDPQRSDTRVLGYVLKRSMVPVAPRSGKQVDFYCICWNVYASVAKEKTYGASSGGAPTGDVGEFEKIIDGPRHGANRLLKHGLIDWGLTDASLYIGHFGEELERCVTVGLSRMASDLGQNGSDHVVIVTSSLGSTITYNALKGILDHTNPGISGLSMPIGAERAVSLQRGRVKLRTLVQHDSESHPPIAFYMFANQYALLARANEVAEPAKRSAADNPAPRKLEASPISTLEEALGNRTVQLVAFTDPDDLLSFALPGKKGSSVKVRNVYVTNNNFAFAITLGPIPLITVANPLDAHVGYEKNPKVLKTMWEGLPLIKPD